MIVKKHNFVSVHQYALDINKTASIVLRYIGKNRQLPGIEKAYILGPRTFVLEKADDYKKETARVSSVHYIFSQKQK